MSTVTFKLPDSIRKQVEKLAEQEGISIDQFLASAAAEKVSAFLSIDYLKKEAAEATDADWDYVMTRVPNRPPLPGDELPEGYVP